MSSPRLVPRNSERSRHHANRGLVPAATPIGLTISWNFGTVDINEDDPRYRGPLERDVKKLAKKLIAAIARSCFSGASRPANMSMFSWNISGKRLLLSRRFRRARRHEPRRIACSAARWIGTNSLTSPWRARCEKGNVRPSSSREDIRNMMPLQLKPPLPPMEARSVDEIPVGDEWQYEPKWDGFRCIAFRDGDRCFPAIEGRPAARALFPGRGRELSNELQAKRFVLDGELAIPIGNALSFDELQLRLHPAASRVQKLAAAHPALFIVFDLLADEDGQIIARLPLRERRKRLETFARNKLEGRRSGSACRRPRRTSPCARKWFDKVGGNLDGVIAKQIDAPYASGERTAMVKVKQIRSADCVVGGFRYAHRVATCSARLLLGLYDEDGLLHHVGFTSAFKASERPALTKKFEALRKKPGFTGNAPGGPSRWSTERSSEWEPVDPKIVVEVTYDHFTGGRFRHGTKILRWRPDKAPRQCTMDQVEHREGKSLALL